MSLCAFICAPIEGSEQPAMQSDVSIRWMFRVQRFFMWNTKVLIRHMPTRTLCSYGANVIDALTKTLVVHDKQRDL